MTQRKLIEGLEIFTGQGAFSEATVEGNVIQNVALLGPVSSNKRVYTRQAMEDAVQLYNGAPIYPDHPNFEDMSGDGNRRFMDLAGKIMNTRLAGDRVRGDVVLVSSNPVGERLKAFAEELPKEVGFSHRADGEISVSEDGTQTVERLTKVYALEIVTEPATVAGLFESKNGDATPKPEGEGEMEIKDLTLEALKAQRPDLMKSITEAVTTEVLETLKEDTASADMKAKLDTAETEKKDLQKKLDEAEVKEAARVRADLVTAKLEEAKLPEKVVSDRFKESLTNAKDEAEIDALIEDRKKLVSELSDPQTPKQPSRNIDSIIREGTGEKKPVTAEVIQEAHTALFR